MTVIYDCMEVTTAKLCHSSWHCICNGDNHADCAQRIWALSGWTVVVSEEREKVFPVEEEVCKKMTKTDMCAYSIMWIVIWFLLIWLLYCSEFSVWNYCTFWSRYGSTWSSLSKKATKNWKRTNQRSKMNIASDQLTSEGTRLTRLCAQALELAKTLCSLSAVDSPFLVSWSRMRSMRRQCCQIPYPSNIERQPNTIELKHGD